MRKVTEGTKETNINETNNFTSIKQRDSMRRIEHDFYIPNDHEFEVLEQVEMERTLRGSKEQINTDKIMNPHRSMTKHIENWNKLGVQKDHTVKAITD